MAMRIVLQIIAAIVISFMRLFPSDGVQLVRERESRLQGCLHHQRCLLVPPVCVFRKDCRVVQVRLIAALNDHGNQRLQLTPGVPRVVDMLLSLIAY